jgi:hypothetical protein
MLNLTGIAPGRVDHARRDTLRASAILGLCLALSAAFVADVWSGPSAPALARAAAVQAVAAQAGSPCTTRS